MNKQLLIAGSIFGFLAVLIGAFGAHGLEKHLDAESITTFETGVKYQMYHALLLLIASSLPMSIKIKKRLFFLIVIGVLFFSGSIYGLATNELTGFDFKKIALITPLGGTLLITAWGMLVYTFLLKNK